MDVIVREMEEPMAAIMIRGVIAPIVGAETQVQRAGACSFKSSLDHISSDLN